jgi:hypothetical protein
VNDSGSAAVELQLARCFAFARHFSTIDGGALQKGDAKVERSAASVNGVSSRAKRNARELFSAIRREELSRLLQEAARPRGERRQLIALAHGLRERAEQVADAVRVVADEWTIS